MPDSMPHFGGCIAFRAISCTSVPLSVTASPRHLSPNIRWGRGQSRAPSFPLPPPCDGGEVSRRCRDGAGDNGAGYGSQAKRKRRLGTPHCATAPRNTCSCRPRPPCAPRPSQPASQAPAARGLCGRASLAAPLLRSSQSEAGQSSHLTVPNLSYSSSQCHCSTPRLQAGVAGGIVAAIPGESCA